MRFRKGAWVLVIIVIWIVAISFSFSIAAVAGENLKSALLQTPSPQCDIKGSGEITISCEYPAVPNDAVKIAEPRLTIDHASFAFDTGEDSHMKIGLTFTNHGVAAISEARTVYVAMDGADNNNIMRRSLPHVDLTKIAPGQTMSFSETLLAPAFPLGTYTIHLWIPSSVPSLKFDPGHNLLLSNTGVPDSATGLNSIGTFTVNVTSGHKKKSR